MSEHDEEYLWSGQGTASEDVAAIERTLERLRWRPQPLVLPSSEAQAEVIALGRERERRSSWWPALAAGLLAAAAVLAVLLWAKLDVGTRASDPAIHPTAPPSSPDLEDPFETAPVPEEPEPEVAPTLSPDLKDPFAGVADPPKETEPRPRSRDGESPDLKNPFKNLPRNPKPKPEKTPSGMSPDLKDPFARESAK